MRLASQASVMEMEEVEQAVVPAMEMRGASSKVVSVISSACKVSSNAVGVLKWANKQPEGLGRGQGGCGG